MRTSSICGNLSSAGCGKTDCSGRRGLRDGGEEEKVAAAVALCSLEVCCGFPGITAEPERHSQYSQIEMIDE